MGDVLSTDHQPPTASNSRPSAQATTETNSFKPPVFYVPRSPAAVLDFSPHSNTPESRTKQYILSNLPTHNVIALIGMGGSGKTTIVKALARQPDIWSAFHGGVWFIHLGHDATPDSFLKQLRDLVQSACPQFVDRFVQLSASDVQHDRLVNELLDRLESMHFLLIFDDVWPVVGSPYNLITAICTAVQQQDGSSFKVLTTTRAWQVGRKPIHSVAIDLNPVHANTQTAHKILCHHAEIDVSSLPSLPTQSQQALHHIIDTCAGLPLTLSVAGTSLLRVMQRQRSGFQNNAWLQYWQSLQLNVEQLGHTGSVGHDGFFPSVRSSLQLLESEWNVQSISVAAIFQSLSVLRKQMWVPQSALEKLWGVGRKHAEMAMSLFSENNIAQLEMDEDSNVAGLRIHDLVMDFSRDLTEKAEGMSHWHEKIIAGYQQTIVGQWDARLVAWWQVRKDGYIEDNLIRHLVGAGRAADALKLLTDYRWIEGINRDERRIPFQMIVSDLRILGQYLKTNGEAEVANDVDIILETVMLCMVPYCINNRNECTFQLFGRLSSLESKPKAVERLMWSIETYALRPWVRAGRRVLRSAKTNLKRVLAPDMWMYCMAIGATNDELVVAGEEGAVQIIDKVDGTKRHALEGQTDHVIGICLDRTSGEIYSCSKFGTVIIWRNNVLWQTFKVDQLTGKEYARCMTWLPKRRVLIIGSDSGRLFVLSVTTGHVVKIIEGHSQRVTAVLAGSSEELLVSASDDHNVRLWDAIRLEPIGSPLEGHTHWVNCVALSTDEKMIASGSYDEFVRLWSVQERRQICEPFTSRKSPVECVTFSRDGKTLYSGGWRDICVWDVTSPAAGVLLIHKFSDERMSPVTSLHVSFDDSELFVSGNKEVFVWKAKSHVEHQAGNQGHVNILSGLEKLQVSENGRSMITCNEFLNILELRDVRDVEDDVERVISRYQIPRDEDDVRINTIAVSNDQRFAAYTWSDEYIVKIIDMRNTQLIHSLFNLHTWVQSLQESGDLLFGPAMESFAFNADGSILTAKATALLMPDVEVEKSVSWKACTGEEVPDAALSTPVYDSRSTAPFLFCRDSDSCVYFDDGRDYLHVGTLEHEPSTWQYIGTMRRMWISRLEGGVKYIDLVLDDTELPMSEEPQLPSLSRPSVPSALPERRDKIQNEGLESYTVFISHAGPDKHTVAVKVYNKLTALGISVFLDMKELHPGDEAPEKMIFAMETAVIFVLIVSPEFAARPWTMRELMCALRRFDEAKKTRESIPVLIPAFYRLGIAGCKSNLFDLTDEDGENVFRKEGFLERLYAGNVSMPDVSNSIFRLTTFTGIENLEKATNSAEDEQKREGYADRIADAVVGNVDALGIHRLVRPSQSNV